MVSPETIPARFQPSPLAAAVYIVGAGPGDPELLTVKAQRLLSQADAVFYANSLVPPQVLDWLRADADRIGTANLTLEDILPMMIERVRAGQSVVRLQSGDPSLYSAIHEQMQALAAAAIPFEVVPGISAYQAAAARLQVELTVPGLVQSIILTRISGRTAVPEGEELAALAAHRTSLCLYLSARHVEAAQAQLLEHAGEAGDHRRHGDDAEVSGHEEARQHNGGGHLEGGVDASGQELPAGRGARPRTDAALRRLLRVEGHLAP